MDLPPYDKFLKLLKATMWLEGTAYGNPKIEKRFYIIACIVSIMVSSEAAFFFLNMSSENFIELAQSAPCICNGVLSISKGIQIGAKRHKIFQLSESLRKLYDLILVDPKKRQLVRRDLVVISDMLYHYLTTNEITLMLPFFAWKPFATDTFLPWFLYYLYSAFCGFVAVIYYTTADGFYVVLSSQICANFCVISDMIENLDATNIDTLNDIVKAHQNILKLSDDLEDIFMVPNLFNMLTGALQICALGLNILRITENMKYRYIYEYEFYRGTSAAETASSLGLMMYGAGVAKESTIGPWEEIPGCLLFLVSVLMQILMMSIFGENIIRDSTKVGDAAYRCSWYNMDSKSRKTILYVMIRSHKAQKLTAYKFSVICYSSFSKIISSSWSYFTILQTLYKPSDTNKA